MTKKYEFHEFADADKLILSVASRTVPHIQEAIDLRGVCFLALSGGSTPRRLFKLLSGQQYRAAINWSKVEFFWGDERCVPPEDPDSNFRMARESLLEPLGIGDAQIHRMPADAEDLVSAAAIYESKIRRRISKEGSNEPPQFDLIMLGMGADGHTASLFPHTAALQETKRLIIANPVPQLNTQRMTFTASLINHAHAVWFVVAGESKAAALAEVLEGPANPLRLPSQLINPAQGRLEFFVDAPAAQELRQQKA